MTTLRRLVLVRHGETDGDSSTRYNGSTDVALSPEGRAQMEAAAHGLRPEEFVCCVASPLRRSWQSAWIVGGGTPVQIEPDFREVDFGRWEGLTAEEIQARDPVAFEEWKSGAENFQYPNGEARADFRERVGKGLDRLLASPVHSALAVLHKGVIRVIVEHLTGQPMADDEPALGAVVQLTRDGDTWFVGRHSSDPVGLAELAAG